VGALVALSAGAWNPTCQCYPKLNFRFHHSTIPAFGNSVIMAGTRLFSPVSRWDCEFSVQNTGCDNLGRRGGLSGANFQTMVGSRLPTGCTSTSLTLNHATVNADAG
jgi:hypothetical protein